MQDHATQERLQAADVLRAAVEASQPVIDAARHSLKVDLPSAPVWLDGDITRLSQIVANLLNNAAKYTPEGGRIGLPCTPRATPL
jgi:signal transduction histidine kinase